MKRLILIGGFSLGMVQTGLAQTPPPKQTSAGGYLVRVELQAGEAGEVEGAKVVSSEAEILNDTALHLARQMKLPVRQKDGAAVKYKITAPLVFPVEGDGGPEAQKAPLPAARLQPGPAYPYELAKSATTGGVIMELQVNNRGNVIEVRVIRSSHRAFELPAIAAATKWLFTPPKVDGKPVATRFFQAMAFEMPGNQPEWKWYVAPRPCLSGFVVTGTIR